MSFHINLPLFKFKRIQLVPNFAISTLSLFMLTMRNKLDFFLILLMVQLTLMNFLLLLYGSSLCFLIFVILGRVECFKAVYKINIILIVASLVRSQGIKQTILCFVNTIEVVEELRGECLSIQ